MILAINTSTPQFGLALLEDNGTVLAEYYMAKEKGHFGSLMPALHFLFSKLKADPHDLKTVVTTIGPGSFTGLRVGISAAKGLSHGLGIPVIGIPSLEALASQIPFSDLPIAPILHSRKQEFFVARFTRDSHHQLLRIMEDTAVKTHDLPSIFDSPCLFIGNDFEGQHVVLKKALGPLANLAPPHCWHIRASAVGALGIKRFAANDVDDPQALDPIYLRPPDISPNPFPLRANRQGPGNEE